ncbi:SOS response-associated peptidase [Oceanibacterium hippocampi]|uniref:Abasic site processing protein n=1 Tax=Oceanibacterium hippocampi TaxID=745714 RepID=A0A1Y5SK24_9PROT|nr:SOS response-associated peptidase [Oceanibacterium hippocampi]SLN39670.1 Putative SOS response-associated peptidase YedK [Oceanibacterium hippocampi]
MCGRYSLTSPTEAMRQLFGFSGMPNVGPRYNIAPTQTAPVIRSGENGTPELVTMRWGLIPSWARDDGIAAHTINARAETVAEKPSFRSAYRQRRCLVPADAFYEWEKTPDGKQPWRIGIRDFKLFAFAGLWESWRAPDGETILTYTIITTTANERIRDIHPRMPVILAPGLYRTWLRGIADAEALQPWPATETECHRIDRAIGNVRNDHPGLIEPIKPAGTLF